MARKEVKVNLSFDYMFRDKKVAHVELLSNLEVKCERYSTDVLDNPLPQGETAEKLLEMFEDRCFPRTRANADELVKRLGLEVYDPIGIVRKTHGIQFDDFYWIRFEGEDITWEDVKIRD